MQLQRVEPVESTREAKRAAQSRGAWCEGCGAIGEDVTTQPGFGTAYCPRCTRMHHMGTLAVDSLAELIAGLIPAWKAYWVGQGADPQYLREILEPTEQALLNGYMRPVITEAFERG